MEEQQPKKDLITRDWLAVERTKLANERTFLAYFRTGVVFMATGVGMIKLTILEEIDSLGYVFIALGPIIILVGIIRLFRIRKVIRKYYK
jgi:putative membrane protein